jgi:hypothetical protein
MHQSILNVLPHGVTDPNRICRDPSPAPLVSIDPEEVRPAPLSGGRSHQPGLGRGLGTHRVGSNTIDTLLNGCGLLAAIGRVLRQLCGITPRVAPMTTCDVCAADIHRGRVPASPDNIISSGRSSRAIAQ